ncbi:MAG: response regulator transcription factor [Bacteroidota bacterium]|nr:response regulator transcription factor [Bacteroidota bacterium]
MEKILIIEDEESILMALEDDLRMEGYQVSSAKDGLKGFCMAKEQKYDLIILDIMLPGMNGFEVCKQLRQNGITTPILILTAKSQEVDKVIGLELGADDYVTKPFSPRELLARVKAIFRRMKQTQQGIDLYHFGDVDIDFKKYEAEKGGLPIYLTVLEFAMLHFLIKNKDQVVSRDSILDKVWGDSVYVYPRTVDTHIAHMRKKIEDDPENPKYIIGVRGIGYKFKG